MNFREIRASPPDLTLLRRFYVELYCREFPDVDERESFANMTMYLRGHGPPENGYHILLALENDEVIGGSISDYFAPSNAGVIEFLVIEVVRRGASLGSALLQHTEKLLLADARQCGQQLGCVMAEINDPFRRGEPPDNVDPFVRARWWGRRGYRHLDFPYVQPALSATQRPVDHLMLCAKVFQSANEYGISAAAVDAFLRDYLVYAMRYHDPRKSPEYRAMHTWLAKRASVATLDLADCLPEGSPAPGRGA